VEELVRVLPRKIELAHTDLFPTWADFLDTFTRVGGVIEAVPASGSPLESPAVNLLIEPTGEVSIHSTHDHIFTADYHYVGASFPQQTANRRALNGAALAVGKVCAEKGIIGFVSVDFVSFRDAGGQQRLWAIDLNIGRPPRPPISLALPQIEWLWAMHLNSTSPSETHTYTPTHAYTHTHTHTHTLIHTKRQGLWAWG
jgi:hypothetical protein